LPPAFFTPAISSQFFQACIFYPYCLLPHFHSGIFIRPWIGGLLLRDWDGKESERGNEGRERREEGGGTMKRGEESVLPMKKSVPSPLYTTYKNAHFSRYFLHVKFL